MSSTVDKHTTRRSRGSRDSDASRAALLHAAREVFDELGYEGATTREIGERAGVDAAMIARYFDSKEGLFLASIARVGEAEDEVDLETVVPYLLERWDDHGHNPISRALTSLGLSEEMRQQVATVIALWLRRNLGAELDAGGLPDAELRAELLVAIAAGVAMTRANGTLEKLAAADRDEVAAGLIEADRALDQIFDLGLISWRRSAAPASSSSAAAATASRSCSSIRAARSGNAATTAPGRSRRVKSSRARNRSRRRCASSARSSVRRRRRRARSWPGHTST